VADVRVTKGDKLEKTESARLSESEEGYVETIYSLIREHGYARVADIAAALAVKPPSVTNMLQKLDQQKFVAYRRYRGVVLTLKGRLLAEALERRHRALKEFLLMIGVSEEQAERDACVVEHKMNRETVDKIAKFVEFARSGHQVPPYFDYFNHYERTRNHSKSAE